MFTALSITILFLAIHWKLSVASFIYLAILLYYYIVVPFRIQPDVRNSEVRSGSAVSVKDMETLWKNENKAATEKIVSFKNKIIFIIALFTMLCICSLHLTANLQDLKV